MKYSTVQIKGKKKIFDWEKMAKQLWEAVSHW